MNGWKVIKDNESGATELKGTGCLPVVPPWNSPKGYKVTDDGWILSPTQKPLLWLPHRWRSDEMSRTWSGRFLGLLHAELPEIVIFEFFD